MKASKILDAFIYFILKNTITNYLWLKRQRKELY